MYIITYIKLYNRYLNIHLSSYSSKSVIASIRAWYSVQKRFLPRVFHQFFLQIMTVRLRRRFITNVWFMIRKNKREGCWISADSIGMRHAFVFMKTLLRSQQPVRYRSGDHSILIPLIAGSGTVIDSMVLKRNWAIWLPGDSGVGNSRVASSICHRRGIER